MARVRMTKRTCEPYIQESWDFAYEYTYCDQCGSFDLGVSSTLPMSIDRVAIIAVGLHPSTFSDLPRRSLSSWPTYKMCSSQMTRPCLLLT
jgi:hypothetical protein